jgi:hypothetical protein
MKRHRALHVILCLRFTNLLWALPLRKDVDGRPLQLDASSAQPQYLESDDPDDQPVSLLAIMQGLQQKSPDPALASEIQLQRQSMSGQTEHERQLLADMGHLENQLESWKQAEKSVESQVSDQASTVARLQAEEAKAVRDEQFAALVWRDCKLAMCAMLLLSIGLCVFRRNSSSTKSAFIVNADPPQQAPKAPRRVRAQPEFVEKDTGREVEDIIQVEVPPTPIETRDLEAAEEETRKAGEEHEAVHDEQTASDGVVESDEKPALTIERENSSSDSIKCQYFNLEEETPVHASVEDEWWNERSSAY